VSASVGTFTVVVGLLAVVPIDADQAAMKEVDSDVDLVALDVGLSVGKPRSHALHDLVTDSWLGVEVGQFVGQALKVFVAPHLAHWALKHVVLRLWILA